MLSEPAVWGCLPSACLLFLSLWKVFFLKTCLPINRPEDLLVGELMHTEVLLWGQGTGPRLVSANPKVPSSPNWSPCPLLQYALHRSGPETGPHRGCSSLQIQNLAFPVILVEKVKTQETEKQHLYLWLKMWQHSQNAKESHSLVQFFKSQSLWRLNFHYVPTKDASLWEVSH